MPTPSLRTSKVSAHRGAFAISIRFQSGKLKIRNISVLESELTSTPLPVRLVGHILIFCVILYSSYVCWAAVVLSIWDEYCNKASTHYSYGFVSDAIVVQIRADECNRPYSNNFH
eukprot:981298-Amorphochlora_amoeboformis.AAC.2